MTRRVLVLEDDDSLRFVISKALSRAGFDVRATASPDTAMDRMIRREADALVADVLLGRENFLDRLDELARLRPDAPVVVMSAQTTAATALGATRRGAYEYLPKPFNLDELVEILDKALKPSGPRASAREEDMGGLVGRAPAMQEAFQALARLARTSAPVLITGPEGSGRAAAGRWLHRPGRTGRAATGRSCWVRQRAVCCCCAGPNAGRGKFRTGCWKRLKRAVHRRPA